MSKRSAVRTERILAIRREDFSRNFAGDNGRTRPGSQNRNKTYGRSHSTSRRAW